MPTHSLARLIASRLRTIAWHVKYDAVATHKSDPYTRNVDEIERLCREFMPSGSGFDSGTTIDFDKSDRAKLVFNTAFHHMHESGMYDGWTEHKVTVTAAHDGWDIKVSGRNRNDIKDYIAEAFDHALGARIGEEWDRQGQEFNFYRERPI